MDDWSSTTRVNGPSPSAAAQAHGSLDHDRGCGRGVVALLTATVLSAALALVLFIGVARAEVPKLIPYGTFAAESPGVAVDQSDGDVYVAGLVGFANPLEPTLGGHIGRFDASGRLISSFGEGFYTGAAVNPANGDVYVVNALESEIDTLNPSTGALLPSFHLPEFSEGFFSEGALVQIATDAAGNVYVPNVAGNDVEEYSSTGTVLHTFTGSGAGALSGPTGVTVDSSGDVWVADAGGNRIEEFDPAGAPLSEIKSEGVRKLALDAHGDIFAIVDNGADFCGSLEPPCEHLVEYDRAGTQIADIGAGNLGSTEVPLPLIMLAVDDSNGRVYVTDGTKNLVWIYGAPAAPVVSRELAAEVGVSEAKLGALINPGGIQTSYRFEYGTTAEYGQSAEGTVGQGVAARTVWAAAKALQPGTTYHYRVIATSALGKVTGPDQSFTTETAAQTSCPANEQLRSGFSAALPDCRAYELVTPPNDASAQPDTQHPPTVFYEGGGASGNHAAGDGDRMSFVSSEVLPSSQSAGLEYVSTRGASGWSAEDVIPLQSYTSDRCPTVPDADMQAYSISLEKGVLSDGHGDTLSQSGSLTGGCNAGGVEVVGGEPLGVENLLLRDNTDGSYRLINVPPPGVTPAGAHFQGASADLSHVVFSEQARLTDNAPGGGEDLFEWDEGALRLVTVLPNGTPAVGVLAAQGATGAAKQYAVSTDGSRIFFTAGGALYVREHAEQPPIEECAAASKACTVQVDASQVGGAGGGGQFQDASADGSRVLFTDENRLTADSTAAPREPDLYECEIVEIDQTGVSKPGCSLSDLTAAQPGAHANVQGVAGTSSDGSYVYFVAKGVLAANERHYENEAGAAVVDAAQAGAENLYLRHDGTTTFIATLAGKDNILDGAAAANGAFFAFTSFKSLTGYENTDANTGAGDPEIYLYNASSNQLACASCNPSGAAPTAGGATMNGVENSGAPGEGAPHYLSANGRLFFDTAEALLPLDTNDRTDVYEYEGGQLHLISTGTSSTESVLLDVSEGGDDVFFLTRQKLLSQDTNEEALSIYDARVDGGFSEPAPLQPCATADGCRTPVSPQPLLFGAPASQTFSGVGNLAPAAPATPKAKTKAKCRAGTVKNNKGRCVKRKPARRARRAARGRKAGRAHKPAHAQKSERRRS